MYILFAVFFALVGQLVPGRFACLSVASGWLLVVIAIITAYPITIDGSVLR